MHSNISILPQVQSSSSAEALEKSPVTQAGSCDEYPRTLQRLPIQKKLVVGAADDPLEEEADTIADRVMRMPEIPFIQRKCTHCEEEEKIQPQPTDSFVQKKAIGQGSAASASITDQIQSTRGGGSSLSEPLKSFMENRFMADFSSVRIHTGSYAGQMAGELKAQAFTVGSDIYFNSGRFTPTSSDSKRLLAHELTHTIQQGKSSPMINRFGESEHRKLGNLAKTKFPYFARVNTDEVALRSSAKGRKTGNEFYNLVASLRKDARVLVVGNVSKWMKVMVESGAALDGKTNQPINPYGLAGYVSEELLNQEAGVFDQALPLVDGFTLTYGDFTALGGDHFAKFVDLEEEGQSAAGREKIKRFIAVLDGKIKGEFEDATTVDKEWAERYKNLAFENISHFSHGGTALETWKKIHFQALKNAANGGFMGNIGMLQRAFAINGFADHFLTDSFSSGHIRVPRMKILEFYQDFFNRHLDSILNYIYLQIGNQIIVQLFNDHPNVSGLGLLTDHDFCADSKEAATQFKQQVESEMKANHLQPKELKKLLVQYIGGAVSKVLHDDDNKSGLEVKSKKHPEGWKAFGDGKLDASFQNYIVEAVEVSKTEVVQAFNMGIDFKQTGTAAKLLESIKLLVYPVSKIEEYIPETNTSKATPLPEWRIDLTGWDTMDKTVQDKLAALIKKYLDDKALDAILQKIPKVLDKEVDWSPDVTVRPRDATRHVLVRFRDNPVEFITSATFAPADFNKAIEKAFMC